MVFCSYKEWWTLFSVVAAMTAATEKRNVMEVSGDGALVLCYTHIEEYRILVNYNL